MIFFIVIVLCNENLYNMENIQRDIAQINRTKTVTVEFKFHHITLVCQPWVRADDGSLSMKMSMSWFDGYGHYKGNYTLTTDGLHDTNTIAEELILSIATDNGLEYWNMLRDKMVDGAVLPAQPPPSSVANEYIVVSV